MHYANDQSQLGIMPQSTIFKQHVTCVTSFQLASTAISRLSGLIWICVVISADWGAAVCVSHAGKPAGVLRWLTAVTNVPIWRNAGPSAGREQQQHGFHVRNCNKIWWLGDILKNDLTFPNNCVMFLFCLHVVECVFTVPVCLETVTQVHFRISPHP